MKDWIFHGAIVCLGLSGAVQIVDAFAPQKVSMQVVTLQWDGNHFYQEHEVKGVERLRAQWAAKIVRGDSFLCVGGGTSSYTSGGSPIMTPDFWTDDDCPPLEAGDVATATWEYYDETGLLHRIGAEITIKNPEIAE